MALCYRCGGAKKVALIGMLDGPCPVCKETGQTDQKPVKNKLFTDAVQQAPSDQDLTNVVSNEQNNAVSDLSKKKYL